MAAPNVPKIRVCDPAAAEAGVEEKWIDLVGSNLGLDIQELYRDNTNLSVYEPAKLQREGLEQAVQLFNAELSEKDRKKFDVGKLQTFDDVAETIKAAAESWENRKRYFPQFKDKLVDFLNSAGHYRNLATVFPTQSQYTSTFCAALSILITAATNYKETAEGLTKALSEITIAAKNVSDLHGLFHTPEMLAHVVNFYASVLYFCLAAIKWYQSRKRRIVGNFKDNLYDEVRGIITSIKACADIIKETASKGNMAEIRILHLKVDRQRLVLKQSIEELKKEELKIWANRMDAFFKDLDQRTLTHAKSRKQSRAKSQSSKKRAEEISPRVPQVYSQTGTIQCIRKYFSLDNYDPKRELYACSKSSWRNLVSYSRFFRERLDLWMTESSSSFLWIRGSTSVQKISTITSFSAQLIDSAKFANLRVVFYLCTFHPRESAGRPIITLLQSLILQLFEVEDMEFETDIDLSEARFRGAGDSFTAAWELFEDAIRLGSKRTTFIAIDCLERFDTDENCGLLVERLKGLAAGNSKGQVVKVLLTSKRQTTRVFESLPEGAKLRLKTTRTRARGRSSLRKGKTWHEPAGAPSTSDELVETGSSARSTESSEVDSDDDDGGRSSDDDIDGHSFEND